MSRRSASNCGGSPLNEVRNDETHAPLQVTFVNETRSPRRRSRSTITSEYEFALRKQPPSVPSW